ncbi:MAG: glycosyltransferase [Dehalococcoidales bacterium]|nr:glycosyltransferase [Dehalococcoidales bacterium]
MERTLLSITPSCYADVKAKGTDWMYEDKAEGGYFSKVYTLNYAVPHSQIIPLSPSNVIYEQRGLQALFEGIWLGQEATVVRANDPFLSGWLGWAVARWCHKPFCISIHSDYDGTYRETGLHPVPQLPYGAANRLAKFVLSHADMVMPIRPSLADYATRHGVESNKIRVIPHGIDAAPYQCEPDLQLRYELGLGGKRVVAVVARLEPDNYVFDLFRIAIELANDKNVVLVVMGDGGKKRQVEQCPNVKCLGFVPRDMVARVLSFADVGLCLRGGYSLIEMCMSALPIVAYDVDWHRDLIWEEGMRVDKRDVAGAADKIRWCLEHREESERIGASNRGRALLKHSLEATRKVKIACYEELVKGGKP